MSDAAARNLSARRVDEFVRSWLEFESEWKADAMRKYLNRNGTYNTSQAQKKIKLAREAELRNRVLKAAAYDFREESIAYLDEVLRDTSKAISAAAELEDVSKIKTCGLYYLVYTLDCRLLVM